MLAFVAGSRNDFGLHLAVFISRGVNWRTGHSDALGREPRSVSDATARPNGAAGDRQGGEDDPRADSAMDEIEGMGTPPEHAPPRPVLPATPVAAPESAVRVYCLELCGARAARIATEEVIASPRLSGPFTAVPDDELLRITRSTASGFAPQVLHPSIPRMPIEGPAAECSLTIPRLARRANGELDRYSQAALAEHLESCVVCRAAEARFERAERAFAAVLGIVPAIEPTPEVDVKVAPPPPPPPAPGRGRAAAAAAAAAAPDRSDRGGAAHPQCRGRRIGAARIVSRSSRCAGSSSSRPRLPRAPRPPAAAGRLGPPVAVRQRLDGAGRDARCRPRGGRDHRAAVVERVRQSGSALAATGVRVIWSRCARNRRAQDLTGRRPGHGASRFERPGGGAPGCRPGFQELDRHGGQRGLELGQSG